MAGEACRSGIADNILPWVPKHQCKYIIYISVNHWRGQCCSSSRIFEGCENCTIGINLVDCGCTPYWLPALLWGWQGWTWTWKWAGIIPLSKVWGSVLWPSWAFYKAAGSIWMHVMLAQVIQVPTYSGESYGCAGMPIERLHFVCAKLTSK